MTTCQQFAYNLGFFWLQFVFVCSQGIMKFCIREFLRGIALFYTNFNYKFSNFWSKFEGHKSTYLGISVSPRKLQGPETIYVRMYSLITGAQLMTLSNPSNPKAIELATQLDSSLTDVSIRVSLDSTYFDLHRFLMNFSLYILVNTVE